MDDDKVPQIKSSKVVGYDLMDLLFVGFFRSAMNDDDGMCWFMVSTDIIHLFCEYFVECLADRCDNCCRLCQNVLLCGFRWLCQECIGEAMN